jgi:hypothetical protein
VPVRDPDGEPVATTTDAAVVPDDAIEDATEDAPVPDAPVVGFPAAVVRGLKVRTVVEGPWVGADGTMMPLVTAGRPRAELTRLVGGSGSPKLAKVGVGTPGWAWAKARVARRVVRRAAGEVGWTSMVGFGSVVFWGWSVVFGVERGSNESVERWVKRG